MAKKKARDDEPLDLSAQLTIRIPGTEMQRLEELSGLISKSIVARLALELGLNQIQKDPTLIQRLAKPPRLGRPPSTQKMKPA